LEDWQLDTQKLGLITKSVINSLTKTLSNGGIPLIWWDSQISPLLSKDRKTVLRKLVSILATNMDGISHFGERLCVNKTQNLEKFECILFDFLMLLHDWLVSQKSWDEALNLELTIYSNYIKQDEDHSFYERAFSCLYSPYSKIFSNSLDNKNQQILISKTAHDSSYLTENSCDATLFWFQNYSILAHTQLVLDLTFQLSSKHNFYASALINTNLSQSLSIFANSGIQILPINDQQNLSLRCDQLIEICTSNKINNIVFVSLPLQSGYLKRICSGIDLTWWSMKFPLGCMPHFDRLVCNRTLSPTKKIFNGALWHCAPFAVKSIHQKSSDSDIDAPVNILKLGVLSREEKFASSNLPEVLHNCLKSNLSTQLFWTGRNKDLNLDKRLHGTPYTHLANRITFSGWVDPSNFLMQIDVLIDTPNLGGMVAYWMMSMGKVVISATDSGSIGSFGSRENVCEYFDLLTTADQVDSYFSLDSDRPYYLSCVDLIPFCIEKYSLQSDLLKQHGLRFLRFFNEVLSDMDRWSYITYQMLQGRDLN
jgi:hypothetical protein